MRRVIQTVTGVANSPVIPLDHRAQVFNVGIEVTISASATYNVQWTMDDVYNPPTGGITWFTLPAPFSAATTSTIGGLTTPASAIRLNVTASTGSATITVLQASGQG